MIVVPARAAALRILAARHGAAAGPADSAYALAEYQREAVHRACAIMHERGGVLVADSVGLGKTYIGAALIERFLPGSASIAVVVPASLLANWRRALQPLRATAGATIDLITHGRLSRGLNPAAHYTLVVVDEAHAFRNPRTRRYRALRRLTRLAKVALLTATPVNNSLADLYFQIRIFAADDAFRDLGIGSLAALLGNEPVDGRHLARLREAVMIRRTRAQLRASAGMIQLPDGRRLRFPATVQLVNVLYPPALAAPEIAARLDRIDFAAYRSATTAALVALALLKRLQSGRQAGLASLERLVSFHQRFLDALGQGRLLPTRVAAANAEQLCFTELMLETLPADLDATDLAARARLDLSRLADLRARLSATRDRKLAILADLLAARAPPLRTIVFSEFRDTAENLWRALRSRFQAGLITGSDAYLGAQRCSRGEVIRRFAPRANHARDPADSEAVFVLFATDVLAEGLNLQDADAVVSYDLPWNPVRLIQRAGRIDRMGSDHERVTVYNFMPDREFDELLGLVRRLRRKLRGLRAAVGQESAILEPHEDAAAFYEELDGPRAWATPQAKQDFREAGPEGCAGATSAEPGRILVVWQAGATVRELVWQAGKILDDKPAADAIVQQGLASAHVAAPAAVCDAITASRASLSTLAGTPEAAREATMLARAIHRAVLAYGVLAGSELLSEADELIARLNENVYEHWQLAAVRRARTPAELSGVLRAIQRSCRASAPAPERGWRLVAALGCD